ncbi:MAG TPA: DUF3047 domain-containing protein [Usitatibacter sp.]|jgi:hypothetical protein|nr:DUF3047 domain-containing protein [Usitatibacter sp.]
MRRAAIIVAAFIAAGAAAAFGEAPIPPFSTAAPGAPAPAGWFPIALPYGKHSEIGVVAEQGGNVLRVRSVHAFGSMAHRMSVDPSRTPRLSWRWKVDRVVEGARLDRKGKEDFAARVYVSFDYPEEMLSFATRAKLAIARTFFDFVPSAAICYVWDNHHAPGTAVWSPHFDHVRVVVLESGNGKAGNWIAEERDIESDFRAAFPAWKGPLPRVNGLIVGNDTDQTGEEATAWFGDLHLGARS